ncbi:MAG: helix-turn-helix domain-containing protein, partial [Patescibacteria group bacterium]
IFARNIDKKEGIEVVDVENYFSGKAAEKTAKKITTNDIIKAVCIYYNIKQSYIKSPSRVENIALARQIIMYLFIKVLQIKLIDAAFLLKRRDHTTAIHARDKIEHLIMTDQNFKEQIDTIVKSLHSST